MKKTTALLIIAFCLNLLGCGRIYGPVEQAKALADEKEEVLTQISKALEADPTQGGVDAARKIFEGSKASLKAKVDAIKSAPQGINSDWSTFMSKTEARHNEMLNAMSIKFAVACWQTECTPAKDALKVLDKDFKATTSRY